MKYPIALAAALSLLGSLPFAAPAPTEYPVCIVGAGPAGLTAAAQLESRERKTVIFEKLASVGGKCQAVYADNSYHPLGALLYSNATYVETLKIIQVAGVGAVPFNPGRIWDYDTTTDVVFPAPDFSPAFAALVGQEFERYVQFWQAEFQPYSAIRYTKGVPANFTVTAAEWLATNQYQALPVLFVKAMVLFGYGDLTQVPILYVLQYLTPDILGFFASLHEIYLIDFHKVFAIYARKIIKGPIHLSTSITKIDRSGPYPIIHYHHQYDKKRNVRPKIQHCASLILAFPPTIPTLETANLDITPLERSIFTPIGLAPYFSSAVRLNALPYGLILEAAGPTATLPPPASGEPVALLRLFPQSNIATAWSWGAYRGNTTSAQVLLLLQETLSLLNRDPNNATQTPKKVTGRDIVGFQANEYFPHFDGKELAAGWYDKYNALQGQCGTYYVSGLNGFETVEFAVRAGIDIVQSFF